MGGEFSSTQNLLDQCLGKNRHAFDAWRLRTGRDCDIPGVCDEELSASASLLSLCNDGGKGIDSASDIETPRDIFACTEVDSDSDSGMVEVSGPDEGELGDAEAPDDIEYGLPSSYAPSIYSFPNLSSFYY